MKRWMLPQDIVAAVGYHHRPAAEPAQTAYSVIIHLANLLAYNATAMESPDAFNTPETIGLAKSRGILVHQDTANKFASDLEAQMEAQAEILEIFLS